MKVSQRVCELETKAVGSMLGQFIKGHNSVNTVNRVMVLMVLNLCTSF